MEMKEEFNQWFEARSGKNLIINSPLLKATLVGAIEMTEKTRFNGKSISENQNRDEVMEMIFGAWKTDSILLIDGLTNQHVRFNFQYIPIPRTDDERKIIKDELTQIEKDLNLH